MEVLLLHFSLKLLIVLSLLLCAKYLTRLATSFPGAKEWHPKNAPQLLNFSPCLSRVASAELLLPFPFPHCRFTSFSFHLYLDSFLRNPQFLFASSMALPRFVSISSETTFFSSASLATFSNLNNWNFQDWVSVQRARAIGMVLMQSWCALTTHPNISIIGLWC